MEQLDICRLLVKFYHPEATEGEVNARAKRRVEKETTFETATHLKSTFLFMLGEIKELNASLSTSRIKVEKTKERAKWDI